jgi:hypothetical protein
MLVEGDGRVGCLVRVDTDGHRHAGTFLAGEQRGYRGGQANFEREQTSVEPLPVGCRQDRTTVLEPTQSRVAVRVVERPAGTLEPYGLQTQGSYPLFNKLARGR